jgi:hypothetical protein
VSALPAFVTPAVWRYHPPAPARVNASLELPSGDRVLAGRRGERWLVSNGAAGLAAASVLAPEDLVGILKTPAGGFIFIGGSGVSYEARSPLAPFFRSSAPLEPLSSVTSSGTAIVGIRRDRGLLRSEDGGATWKPVAVTAGRHGVPKFVSVLLSESGHGLALAVPEALFESHDDGQTFTPRAVRSIGAFGLERLPDRQFGVVSALGMFRFRENAPAPLESLEGLPSPAVTELKAPRGPDAIALNEGRAVTTAGSYFELGMRDKAAWQLTSGPLAGPLASRDMPELAACKAVRLAAFERSLRVACFRLGAEAASQSIELLASDDGGNTFRAEGLPLDGNLASFHMALGAGDTLLLTGVCATYHGGAGCAPQGIARRAPKAAKPSAAVATPAASAKPRFASPFELSAAATPSLADTALSLAFSLDGRVAYAVGRRTKGGVLAVFVSRDRGRSFEAQDLSLPTGDGSDAEERWEGNVTGVHIDALVPAEDGSVGLAVSRYRSRARLVGVAAARAASIAGRRRQSRAFGFHGQQRRLGVARRRFLFPKSGALADRSVPQRSKLRSAAGLHAERLRDRWQHLASWLGRPSRRRLVDAATARVSAGRLFGAAPQDPDQLQPRRLALASAGRRERISDCVSSCHRQNRMVRVGYGPRTRWGVGVRGIFGRKAAGRARGVVGAQRAGSVFCADRLRSSRRRGGAALRHSRRLG